MFRAKSFKKWTSLFMTLFMILSFLTPFDVKAAEKTVDIQILATSDTHGRFMPYDYAQNVEDKSGSLTQVYTAVKELRKANPNTILVDAGDSIQDNSANIFLKDDIHPMIEAMNEMGYDTWTYGNHEFNYGVPTLEKVSSQFKGVPLCGNVYKNDGTRLAKPYTIVEKAGVKVGIIGMVSPNITRWDAENLKGYKVTNPVDETKKAVAELKDKVDVMIAVLHMSEGSEYSEPGSGAKEIAEACPELTAIVAAHEHKAVPGTKYNGVLLVENLNKAQSLAAINIKLTEENGKYKVANKETDVTSKLLYVKDSKTKAINYEADKDLSASLQPYNKKAIDDANVVIGELKGGNLVPDDEVKGIPTSQIQETAMINLINEVQLYYSKADVSAAAAFDTRANMKAGPIKKCDTSLIYKYDNTLYLLEVTGKQLKDYMEWSAKYYNTYKPGDLTVSFNPDIRGYNYDMFSGVKYEIDISKEPGERIVNLRKMDNTPIKDTDVLKLAVNNYRANSHLTAKTGNEIYKDGNLPKVLDKDMVNGAAVRDLIGQYIKEVKGGVITPELNNNWKIVGNNWDAAKRAEAVKLINDGKIELPVSADGRTPNVAPITEAQVEEAKVTKKADIISFNDYHGIVEENGKDIGIAKFVGAIKAYKKENPNTVVVSAGDMYQGTAISNLNYGAPINDMVKLLEVPVSAVGNHEFDWGTDRIAKWAKDAGFDFLASNIYDKATGKPVEWAKPYKIIDVNGLKIGFIGLATPETAFKTKPTNVENLEFKKPEEAAKEWTAKLKSGELPEGKADVVIALTHLGSEQDSKTKEITGEAADLAKADTGLDAIISGHTHMTVAGTVNNIPIVQGYKQGRGYGKLQIAYNTKTNKASIVPSYVDLSKDVKTLPVDADAKAIVDKYVKASAPLLNEVIATTDKDLTHDKSGASILGEWTCEVMAKASGSQIAITNGGGLRTSIKKGNITVGDLYQVMPFDNTLVTMDLKGSDLKANIEHGIDNKEVGWVQISGVMVKYDMNKPEGNRIVEMKLTDGTPVDMNKYYKVVTNDFMKDGGDKYDFKNAKNMVDTNIPIRDALIKELKAVKNLSFNKVNYLSLGTASDVKTDTKPQTIYVVKSGDCLWIIGKRYNVPYMKIAEFNKIKNPNLIFPGQKLIIPAK